MKAEAVQELYTARICGRCESGGLCASAAHPWTLPPGRGGLRRKQRCEASWKEQQHGRVRDFVLDLTPSLQGQITLA